MGAHQVRRLDRIARDREVRLDGQEYPVKNDPGKTTVALKRVDARTIEDTSAYYGTKVSYTLAKQP